MALKSPKVSDEAEGQPWFLWVMLGIVVVVTLLALLGYILVATIMLSIAAVATGVMRLVLREGSPWKVRSVAFDSTFSIVFGVGLLGLYLSILFIP